MASGQNKPDGLTVITPEESEHFLEQLPIGEFHGVGKATREKMQSLGIYTGSDLKQWHEADLVRHFGKSGQDPLHATASGHSRRSEEHTSELQSRGQLV